MKNEIADQALHLRRAIIETVHRAHCGHAGCCLSCADILTVLYHRILNLDPWEERDIFILSKAHAAVALYCMLDQKGILPDGAMEGFYRNGGSLPAHLDRFSTRGVEVSAGSLGHGFNMGLGMALGFKLQDSGRRVFTVIGDGETQEGSVWEGAMFAAAHGLENFTAIMDYKNLQGYGRAREICAFEPLADKWRAFGWDVHLLAGHDTGALEACLSSKPAGKPRIIIAETVKGKGVPFMEDRLEWHYYFVTDELKEKALAALV